MAESGTYAGYQSSGFNEASGTEAIKNYQNSIPVTDADLRTQAVEQYQPTYEQLNRSYADQLSRLIQVQSSDEALLNEQYNNSIASMTAQLKKRGLLPTTQLEQAQTAALNKHKNEAKDVRASIYNVQKALPQQQQALLKSGYEDAIAQRVSTNRSTNIPLLSDMLEKLAELQEASFEDYLNFILQKSGSSGGGGYSRSYGSSSSASSVDTTGLTGNASGSDFGGSNSYKLVFNLGKDSDTMARGLVNKAYSQGKKQGDAISGILNTKGMSTAKALYAASQIVNGTAKKTSSSTKSTTNKKK